MMDIALFGTSADPPTVGHQAILLWLLEHFDYVAVWAADNPFKSHQASLHHRLAMLQLLIDDIQQQTQGSCVAPIALHPELSSPYALVTVERAKSIWADTTFTFVIGSDLVAQMPRWYNIEDLLHEVKLLVVPRPSYPLEESSLDKLRQLGAVITIANLTPPKTSSTAYRQWGDTEAVTATVDNYIHHHHLYQDAWQDAAPRAFPATASHQHRQ